MTDQAEWNHDFQWKESLAGKSVNTHWLLAYVPLSFSEIKMLNGYKVGYIQFEHFFDFLSMFAPQIAQ